MNVRTQVIQVRLGPNLKAAFIQGNTDSAGIFILLWRKVHNSCEYESSTLKFDAYK